MSMAEDGWKSFLSRLFKKASGSDAEPEPVEEFAQSTFEQVVIRLQQLVESRNFVEVRFPGRATNTYQSIILKVDPLERFVLIDELFPAHGAFFISPGDEVEVTMKKGIPIRFNTWVKAISIDEADGIPAYRLALPDAVEAKQRRTHFRVQVDPDAGVRLRIRGPEASKVLCTVSDLSHSGIGFSTQGNLSDQLRANNRLNGCQLSFPGATDIPCDIEVRSFEFRRQPYRHTVIGARFDKLTPAAEKQLEQFLVLIQRQQRRESMRP
jgi:c-di-GMP-binding flagellar brake protein YcgR